MQSPLKFQYILHRNRKALLKFMWKHKERQTAWEKRRMLKVSPHPTSCYMNHRTTGTKTAGYWYKKSHVLKRTNGRPRHAPPHGTAAWVLTKVSINSAGESGYQCVQKQETRTLPLTLKGDWQDVGRGDVGENKVKVHNILERSCVCETRTVCND